ncbi:hypothetical protein [Paramagnetospirillum magneticum]|uniref:hypothetical protein n=1 Tax=Paramagnetospirillum magneticum TaxID=84159 RepID=UPI001305357C|nr:hypothetical protein [Paramagnetospirillum magneticum]
MADSGPRRQRHQEGSPPERQIETGKQTLEEESRRHQRHGHQPRHKATVDGGAGLNGAGRAQGDPPRALH